MSVIKEFKEFAMRGNVIDLAVGVVIGGAFGKIVASLVADVIMPPIGLLIGGVNFTDLKWEMKAKEVVDGVEQAAVTLNYGNFLQVTFDFMIVAFAIALFFIYQLINLSINIFGIIYLGLFIVIILVKAFLNSNKRIITNYQRNNQNRYN